MIEPGVKVKPTPHAAAERFVIRKIGEGTHRQFLWYGQD